MTTEKYIQIAAELNSVMDEVQNNPLASKLFASKAKTIAQNHNVSIFEVTEVMNDLMTSILEIIAEDNAAQAMLN